MPGSATPVVVHAVTMGIPHQFGGLTMSMLRRSVQMAEDGRFRVQVLTLGHHPALDDVRADLHARGLLTPDVRLVNLWEEVAGLADDAWDDAAFAPDVDAPVLTGPADDVLEIRRPDGTLMARQRWRPLGARTPIAKHGDEVVRTEIWGRDERFLGGWHGRWSLWRWWLARVLREQPGHVVVDNAMAADCLAAAPLPGVPTTYVVHNAHVAASREAPYGRQERWRAFVTPRSSAFDAVVYLTESQRRDAHLLHGDAPSHVVPHAIDPPVVAARRSRPAGRGVVVANVDKRKRLGHAVRAVTAAASRAEGVELHLFGRGPDLDAVESTIAELGAPVTVEGYTSEPARAFADASYMLLTSSREGFALVLVEAMSAGCLPISYDVPYGPADIVTDGVDGFLVPAGDIGALTDRVVGVARTPRRRLRRMRRAAQRRAREFAPGLVIPRWLGVLDSAARQAALRDLPEPTAAEVERLERAAAQLRFEDCRVEAVVGGVRWADDATAVVTLTCTVVGAGPAPGTTDVVVELVDRPTGARTRLETTVTAADGLRTTLEVAVGPTESSDAVVLVTARIGEIEVVDVVVPPDDHRGWLPLPVAAARRPVLVVDRRTGLRPVVATPHVAADVFVVATTVTVRPVALTGSAPVDAVEAVGIGGTPDATITGTTTADGAFVLEAPAVGRWKLRARAGDRWRDVAWRGPDDVPREQGAVSVELTARGYVRLRHDAAPAD